MIPCPLKHCTYEAKSKADLREHLLRGRKDINYNPPKEWKPMTVETHSKAQIVDFLLKQNLFLED